jgi:dihydrofolate reductase
MQYKLITALCRGGGIGYNGQLPWSRLAQDMRFFYEMTCAPNDSTKVAVLMGRKTWDSIPPKAKPLKNRDNIIISSSSLSTTTTTTNTNNTINTQNIIHINNIDQLKKFEHNYHIIWIIGGASIYEQCIRNKNIIIEEMYITFVNACYDFDIKFPEIWLRDRVNEDEEPRSLFCGIGSLQFQSNATFTVDTESTTHYSIETINTISASLDCPELRFLKFNRIIQNLTP